MDIDKTLADDIISCCLALAHDTEKANDIYDRLRHYETHVAEEHQLDPIHIRAYLSNPVINTLTRLIPDKHFVVNTRSAKLSKAARIWTLPTQLFHAGTRRDTAVRVQPLARPIQSPTHHPLPDLEISTRSLGSLIGRH